MSTKVVLASVAGVLALHAGALHFMGQPWISTSGIVSLWEGRVYSAENSQQLTDWYTFSHIIHGFLFYWFLSVVAPRLSWTSRLFLAMGLEVGWELLENSPFIINRYRETALALGYSGDSILNSVSDVVAMCLGFMCARFMPVIAVVVLALCMELGTGYLIRDNLTLNVLNLIDPIPAVQVWQGGAPLR